VIEAAKERKKEKKKGDIGKISDVCSTLVAFPHGRRQATTT
jgi:hypothetical protein